MKTRSLKLPEALDTRITKAARTKGVTRSAFVREALTAYLGRSASTAVSAHALAHDLAGCVSGPPDLSRNKEHMRGYGQSGASAADKRRMRPE